MMDVKTKCVWDLIKEGVPESAAEEWYEMIYLNTGLSEMSKELTLNILKMSDGDLMDLLTIYGEEGSAAALEAMVKYFSRFYGITKILPVVESSQCGMMACDMVSRYRKIQPLSIRADSMVYDCNDGAAILIMTVHEMLHAWQADMTEKWLASLGGAEIDFYVNPREARRELLYYLNYRSYVKSDMSKALYQYQLVEHEAHSVSFAMMERLGRFSPKVLDRAMRSLKAIGACAG